MVARLALAALVVAAAVAAVLDDDAPGALARKKAEADAPATHERHRWPTVATCRGRCFVWRERRCLDVEEACGRMRGVYLVDGLPYDCAEVEPVACRLTHGIESCLAACGEEEAP